MGKDSSRPERLTARQERAFSVFEEHLDHHGTASGPEFDKLLERHPELHDLLRSMQSGFEELHSFRRGTRPKFEQTRRRLRTQRRWVVTAAATLLVALTVLYVVQKNGKTGQVAGIRAASSALGSVMDTGESFQNLSAERLVDLAMYSAIAASLDRSLIPSDLPDEELQIVNSGRELRARFRDRVERLVDVGQRTELLGILDAPAPDTTSWEPRDGMTTLAVAASLASPTVDHRVHSSHSLPEFAAVHAVAKRPQRLRVHLFDLDDGGVPYKDADVYVQYTDLCTGRLEPAEKMGSVQEPACPASG